ncbi:hypothetical protein PAHAL_7G109900 [Panicum hallii]|uniref:Response regulatory domain-containing protein n=1 Tax=Panicum hallii TaxID=206008 RepID=A0A2T8IBS4_9POAL|nr:hypothetical protein PAHAL_7G109900 [Panicum hallii]
MDERAKLCPANGLSVIVVDEDKHHANSTRSMLCTLNYHATAYTSPIKALEFLEGHAQEVDLALVAVHMEELHGFQFLDIVSDAHKNVQVIMMSNETTMDTMKRCIKLGARFLVNKPIDAHTINNLWQHLDLKDYSRMDYIKNLLQGNGEAHDLSYLKENTKTKKGYICWNEYLHRKFLRALEILGEGAASPRNIEILMNVEGVNRKHIASHLQCRHRASTSKSAKRQEGPNTSLNSLDIQQEEMTADEDMPHAKTGSFSDNNNAHAAMQRSIQFGTIYDESEYFYYSSGDEATEDGVDMMEDDGTSASSFTAQVSTAETFSAEGTKDILNNNSSKKQDRHGDKVGKAIKLVDYSESEDDEI